MGRLIRQNRLFRDRVEIRIGLNEPQPNTARYLGLSLALLLCQPAEVGVNGQPVGVKWYRICPITHPEPQNPIAFDRVEPIAQHQRLQGGTRLSDRVQGITADIAEKLRGIKMHHTRAAANLPDYRGQRTRRGSSVQPMTPAVILPIAP